MKILLLVSAFNGLTQRVWCELQARDHEVGVELASTFASPSGLTRAVQRSGPDLILCPYLKHRVPAEVWRRWPTVIIHPGPPGDRGPSSLDHAIRDGRDRWGVTALSAVEEMDAGPIWASSIFDLPPEPIPKSALYNGRVADAAMECVAEVLRMVDAGESPVPAETYGRAVLATAELPLLRRDDFRIDWGLPAADVARRIAAADGAPGAPATVNGSDYCLYDAVASAEVTGFRPGTVIGRNTDAVAIACGRGTLWVGYAAVLRERRGNKLPATAVIDAQSTPVRDLPADRAETTYERDELVGYLTFRAYNGAIHTEQCRRLTSAIAKALTEDTRVLVLRGTEDSFANGIHLGMIDAATDPAGEAWENIRAIDELCMIVAEADQVTVTAYTANAGAGGAMMALSADVTLARTGVVLNPYYDMGIFGSELHTWSLAAKIGHGLAERLLDDRLPVSATEAARIGLIAGVGPRAPDEFDDWLRTAATHLADPVWADRLFADRGPARPMPLSYHETIELAEMAADLFEDRHGFAAARHAFLRKEEPNQTPARLRFW